MPKLSELINQYTVTMAVAKDTLSELDLKFYPPGTQKWLATITTTSGRSLVMPMFYPVTHVVKPSNNKYHPRYGADTSIETPAGEGAIMTDEWWYRNGQAVKPRLDEVAARAADLAFFMQDIKSFEEYCLLKNYSNDSLKAYLQYQADQATYAALQVFLDAAFDLFVNAEVDL